MRKCSQAGQGQRREQSPSLSAGPCRLCKDPIGVVYAHGRPCRAPRTLCSENSDGDGAYGKPRLRGVVRTDVVKGGGAIVRRAGLSGASQRHSSPSRPHAGLTACLGLRGVVRLLAVIADLLALLGACKRTHLSPPRN